MGKKEEILELIKRSKEGITTKEIAKELGISEKAVNVYISRDLKDKIESKGIRDRYKLWFVIEQQSNNIMNNKNNNSNNKLTTIKEMFEKGVIKVYKDKLTENYKKLLEEL